MPFVYFPELPISNKLHKEDDQNINPYQKLSLLKNLVSLTNDKNKFSNSMLQNVTKLHMKEIFMKK